MSTKYRVVFVLVVLIALPLAGCMIRSVDDQIESGQAEATRVQEFKETEVALTPTPLAEEKLATAQAESTRVSEHQTTLTAEAQPVTPSPTPEPVATLTASAYYDPDVGMIKAQFVLSLNEGITLISSEELEFHYSSAVGNGMGNAPLDLVGSIDAIYKGEVIPNCHAEFTISSAEVEITFRQPGGTVEEESQTISMEEEQIISVICP